MSKIGLVFVAGIKNMFRVKVALILFIPLTLIVVGGMVTLVCLLLIRPEMASASPDRGALEGYISLVLYSAAIISIGVTLNSTLFHTLVKEKARGNLTALLATPLTVSEIWLGKSLALFIPGLVLGILLSALSWLVVNLAYFLPDIGFVFSLEGAVSSLIAVPLIYLFFGMFVHVIGLTSKPATGNVIAQVFLPVIANVMIQIVVRGGMDAGSWQFMAMNLGLAVAIGGLVLGVKSRVTPERIVISG